MQITHVQITNAQPLVRPDTCVAYKTIARNISTSHATHY